MIDLNKTARRSNLRFDRPRSQSDLMSGTDINLLAEELHAAAVEKGFWDVENALDKHIAKMHSELSEAVQADRAGIMYEIEYEGAKPEGVAAELADFVMMVLDYTETGHALRYVLECMDVTRKTLEEFYDLRSAPLPVVVNMLHDVLCNASNATTDGEDICIAIVTMICVPEIWLKDRGYDLWEIIRAKMEYNRSRPKLHGRAY